MTTLVWKFKKIDSDHKTKDDLFYSNLKAEIVINGSDIDDVFESNNTTIISSIQSYLGIASGWIIDSVIEHSISISKYDSLAWSSYY